MKTKAGKANEILVYVVLLAAAFSFRVILARFCANDTSDDGKIYAQLARNVLERRVYSHESEPPFAPSLIRLPGYPLFLAGVYSIFGHGDDDAVRIVQALIDTATCGLIALIAFLWEPEQRRKRRSSIAALALATFCPFTAIYTGTILTETLAMFLIIATCLASTFALRSTQADKVLWLLVIAGLLGGVSVLTRPDSALFVLAVGITLVISLLRKPPEVQLKTKREELLYRTARASYLGATFSLAFCLVLVPWTIRNYRVFHFFQPLASRHAQMPGEFVPRGYYAWLRTWIDDGRYLGPVLWSLDAEPIQLNSFPERAFDSAAEKQQVATLLDRYNHPIQPEVPIELDSLEAPLETETDEESEVPAEEPSPGDEEADEIEPTDAEESAAPGASAEQLVEMTPEIDAGFARLARERISRSPLRYYAWLPIKRANSLWFNTHSQFYTFEGELLPLSNLNSETNQQYWLPLFGALTAAFTLLGIAGGVALWQTNNFTSRQWVLLVVLFVLLRLGFFATLESPEPRYTVEVFPFLAILGGIAASRFEQLTKKRRRS